MNQDQNKIPEIDGAVCGRLDVFVRRFVAGCPHKADCVEHGVVIPDECPDCQVFKAGAGCVWCQDDDGIFQTLCGNSFEFYAEGPKENKFQFCPYCGNRLHA
jgi:hypothetical protein